MKKRDILIWLNNLGGINNRYMDVILNHYNNIEDIWNDKAENIYSIQGIGKKLRANIISCRDDSYYKNILDNVEKSSIEIVTILDHNYPKNLRSIPDPPRVLYVRGSLIEDDSMSISLVGARKSSPYGKWVTEKFSRELCNYGITVVSGMALGVDSIAHRECIVNKNRTIAVLGTGADIVYPSRNKDLYSDIYKNGAIVSEFPLGSKPLAFRFPQRNRIISGLSLGTIVVEADLKSGTLITANHALEQGREVFAIPGNINSQTSRGTNRLIQDGAKLTTSIEDIIEEIVGLRDYLSKKTESDNSDGLELGNLDISEFERRIVREIYDYPKSLEELSVKSKIAISELTSILVILEIKGLIKRQRDGLYSRS